MKLRLFSFTVLLALRSISQNYAVLSHGSIGSSEFRGGCPSNWPAATEPIGLSTELPEKYATGGWVLMTQEQLDALKASLAESKESWNKSQEAKHPYTIKKNEFFRRLTPIEWKTIREATKVNDDIAYLWDTLMSLDEGIQGPPLADGSDEQKKTKAARDALAQLFTPARADELLKRQ